MTGFQPDNQPTVIPRIITADVACIARRNCVTVPNYHNCYTITQFCYLREFDWRPPNRHLSNMEGADALIADAKGKRLFHHKPGEQLEAEGGSPIGFP
jgi:hypothetical protein